MAHPDHGDLLALLDGELGDSESRRLRAHLVECSSCSEEARSLEAASAKLEQALAVMDGPTPSLERVRVQIDAGRKRDRASGSRGSRGRADGQEEPHHRKPRFLRSMTVSWAASITLLLTAVAVSALPGSPVRRWLQDGWTALTGSSAPASAPSSQAPATEGLGATPGPATEGGETGGGSP
jgi:anti-sigma factor RsiW